ncbi:MAG: ester cyclase [Thermoleophilaceae bacterium]|nr:ester cyclase [Thermoleophilaceae bacterium]
MAPFGTTAPGTVHGPSAARETPQWLRARFPDLLIEIQSIVADGDMFAVRMLSEGTNLGKLGGVGKAPGPPAFVRAIQSVRGAVRAQA